ncbi:hypothetical protein EYZ11_010070 [Aspergillus tanneri]|uniref:F-box domain-containing protein n=1 Tax=Aspergillus tanneri TaxID=1220188 RepID=A0A4S3J8F3_9EURO|nr:hypothetical protein EYZ11_010070 [Aspergillus tanneri]
MDTVPPSYQTATTKDAWSIIAQYIPSSDLCAATLVCQKWHGIFMPFLWGNPASHFGTDNDAVYGVTRYDQQAASAVPCTYNIRLLLADQEPNATSQGLAEALLRFQELVYLDLSYTTPARDRMVLSSLSQLEHLQVLKLQGIGLKDTDAEFLANAVGLRVRFLDLRDNMLTDMAVRSLLQASFPTHGDSAGDRRPSAVPVGTFDSFLRLPLPFSSPKWLSSPTLDEHFLKALTQPLSGRSWVEDLSHGGITHLYIADNQITVEGVASLLASARLHVLDVGTVDTAESLHKGQRSLLSQPRDNHHKLPGAEKLIPILGSTAKESLTYLRVHHAICTADNPYEESAPSTFALPELSAEAHHAEQPVEFELEATNQIHELPTNEAPVFELEGSPIPQPLGCSAVGSAKRTVHEDEPLPEPRRGSVFAPEVAGEGQDTVNGHAPATSPLKGLSILTTPDPGVGSKPTGAISQYGLSLSMDDDLRDQKIQELISKRPKSLTLPRRNHKCNSFPYLHPSHVPHLETLVLTDVPSHVPADSHYLRHLKRFITACSNEALLAVLQAGSDYSLPPGRHRAKAEQERAGSLFALRRLVLEITPTNQLSGSARRTAWKPTGFQSGASKSSTGDRDLENLWTASMDDFSFFDETECGVPENDPGKYFPMAALNEKVTLIPGEDDSGHSRISTPDRSSSPGLLHHHSSLQKHTGPGSTNNENAQKDRSMSPPQAEVPTIGLVAELAAFRRAKRIEYEEVVRRDRKRRSTVGFTSLLSPSPSASSVRSSSPSPSVPTTGTVSKAQLAMAYFVEGHWKGEVKIVRNAAPKGRSGVVDMYGNYFEKGYLYP